jgi:hypothetical protein
MPSTEESSIPRPPDVVREGKWWWQDAGLRRLYLLIVVVILSSATNGYDGYIPISHLSMAGLLLMMVFQVNDEWVADSGLLA